MDADDLENLKAVVNSMGKLSAVAQVTQFEGDSKRKIRIRQNIAPMACHALHKTVMHEPL